MNKKYWKFISITIMILIFIFSSQDGNQSSKTSGFFTNIVLMILPFLDKSTLHFLIRKGAHFTIFGCLGFSFYQTWKRKNMYIPLVLSFLYACSDEIHQSFTAARSCQFSDVLLDTCGAFIFIFITYLYYKKKGVR